MHASVKSEYELGYGTSEIMAVNKRGHWSEGSHMPEYTDAMTKRC